MPIPSPFHSRTAPLCESHEWRNWSGYLAASTYEPSHEREYYAIRNAAALIDVSPLFKYELHGPGAVQAVNRIITRDISRCAVGQVLYSPWCDDDGMVIDDGTIARLDEDTFRMTAAESNLTWLEDCSLGFDCTVRDVSADLAALALQGPNSRRILEQVFSGMFLTDLQYYHLAQGYAGSIPLTVTRTGYTGDLGYELWVAPEYAENLWDLLVETGKGHGITPAGMVALDIARIEAGLIMLQVDYISSRKALIEAQKSSPFEIGLGWAVDLEKGDFVGQAPLQREKKTGSKWKLVGLEVKWESLEALYGEADLVPQLSGRASRSPVPIYKEELHIGQATSLTFSPILKKYIAIGTVESQHARKGAALQIEVTVEYVRHRADAVVIPLPFFNPPRKRA
jgi:glycine cleavage system T protein (aminomethyltransferase)